MLHRFSLLFIVCLVTPAHRVAGAGGSVELDEYSFDKIKSKFQATLVKFDVAFPYGDKHDTYQALAKDSKEVDDLLIAEVGVKDYGEKDNEALATKYGATKENFPVVKLFTKDKTEPISFDDTKGFTSDELRRFIRENSGIYLSLPGCIKELDKLGLKFMKSNSDDKKRIMKETELIVTSLPEQEAVAGKIYKTLMEKTLEKGDGFIKTEFERVKKILNSKVSDEKKKELTNRLNILQTFQLFDKQTGIGKEEL